MAERLKAQHWKCCWRLKPSPGFESLSLRFDFDNPRKTRGLFYFCIPPDQIANLFEAFARGATHGQQGVGLGLSIASQAAKVMNVPLMVDSELGHGATFRMLFAPPPNATIPGPH